MTENPYVPPEAWKNTESKLPGVARPTFLRWLQSAVVATMQGQTQLPIDATC